MSEMKSSYKAQEVMEPIEVYFYRPVGYWIAVMSNRIGLTPNAVTLLGMCFSIPGGHLLYYEDGVTNAVGVFLLIFSVILDHADGQLARMSNQSTALGRILDGVADNVKFISIYIHVCLRISGATGWWWIFAVAALSGMCHSVQSAMADYYRNAYVRFGINTSRRDLDKSSNLISRNKKLSWREDFYKKILIRLYVNYTTTQERFSRNFQKLQALAAAQFVAEIPRWFVEEYRALNKPLLKYYKILTANTRMVFLFIVLFIGRLSFYFLFELVVLNAVLVYVTIRQERINSRLAHRITDLKRNG